MQPELGHSLLQKSLHVGMPGSSSLVFISITLRHILNGPKYGERARTFDLGLRQLGFPWDSALCVSPTLAPLPGFGFLLQTESQDFGKWLRGKLSHLLLV